MNEHAFPHHQIDSSIEDRFQKFLHADIAVEAVVAQLDDEIEIAVLPFFTASK
jgi:hypothetical protein